MKWGNNMYIEMKGRLGNQLFIYAFSRYIQSITGDSKFYFDFSFVNNKRKELQEDNWTDNLKNFNIKEYCYIQCKRRAALDCSLISQKIVLYFFWGVKKIFAKTPNDIYKLEKKFQPMLNRKGIYLAENRYVKVNTPQKKYLNNIIITGHFESSKFFESIKQQLFEELTPKFPPLESNKNLYQIIESTESVCVTIRRGDFVSVPSYKKEFFLCDFKYFKNGMDYIHSIYPECKFIIFSDDINWVKENYSFGYEVYYESGDDPVWEKLRLMYSCKHFVISNSTFSWWAQYLSRNDKKIVVSPNRWYNNTKQSGLIEESFYKIEVS